MDKKEFGERLKNLRLSSGLDWDTILGKLEERGFKIARPTVYGYEHGRAYPDPDVFLALCDIYGSKDVFSEFGAHLSSSDGYEDITLYEDEYTPENWAMIKNFLALVPAKGKQ